MAINRYFKPAEQAQVDFFKLPQDLLASSVIAAEQQYAEADANLEEIEALKILGLPGLDKQTARDANNWMQGLRDGLVETYDGDLRKANVDIQKARGKIRKKMGPYGEWGVIQSNYDTAQEFFDEIDASDLTREDKEQAKSMYLGLYGDYMKGADVDPLGNTSYNTFGTEALPEYFDYREKMLEAGKSVEFDQWLTETGWVRGTGENEGYLLNHKEGVKEKTEGKIYEFLSQTFSNDPKARDYANFKAKLELYHSGGIDNVNSILRETSQQYADKLKELEGLSTLEKQKELNKLGFNLTEDGVMGNQTKQAINMLEESSSFEDMTERDYMNNYFNEMIHNEALGTASGLKSRQIIENETMLQKDWRTEYGWNKKDEMDVVVLDDQGQSADLLVDNMLSTLSQNNENYTNSKNSLNNIANASKVNVPGYGNLNDFINNGGTEEEYYQALTSYISTNDKRLNEQLGIEKATELRDALKTYNNANMTKSFNTAFVKGLEDQINWDFISEVKNSEDRLLGKVLSKSSNRYKDKNGNLISSLSDLGLTDAEISTMEEFMRNGQSIEDFKRAFPNIYEKGNGVSTSWESGIAGETSGRAITTETNILTQIFLDVSKTYKDKIESADKSNVIAIPLMTAVGTEAQRVEKSLWGLVNQGSSLTDFSGKEFGIEDIPELENNYENLNMESASMRISAIDSGKPLIKITMPVEEKFKDANGVEYEKGSMYTKTVYLNGGTDELENLAIDMIKYNTGGTKKELNNRELGHTLQGSVRLGESFKPLTIMASNVGTKLPIFNPNSGEKLFDITKKLSSSGKEYYEVFVENDNTGEYDVRFGFDTNGDGEDDAFMFDDPYVVAKEYNKLFY